MKISQLIDKLREQRDIHGNIEVAFRAATDSEEEEEATIIVNDFKMVDLSDYKHLLKNKKYYPIFRGTTTKEYQGKILLLE